eukprot:TRINITY_DN17067_c0_g1_i1.p1 TRINITY_DN17067_c0_g1~~TRINITY_DN17067_c0_g1_i1.p1  ORF type:complete len:483 (-),score=93.76 TRINITY_DN17067_c0_g1_i1:23-1471(-)
MSQPSPSPSVDEDKPPVTPVEMDTKRSETSTEEKEKADPNGLPHFIAAPLRFLFGELSRAELVKYSLLSLTFLFIIGTYWLLRPLKDGVFSALVGLEYQPRAKMASVVVVILLIMVYSKLIDVVPKHQLFYIIGSFYMVLYCAIAYFLSSPVYGMNNPDGPSVSNLLGWLTYLSIESFGSIVVALFWSFVSSCADSSEAKKGYPLIVAGSQIGSISGPTIATYAATFGIDNLFYFASLNCGVIMLVIAFFVKTVPTKPASSKVLDIKARSRPGIFEGVRLIATRPYVCGILGISTIYEVIGTIMDYQMKVLGKAEYTSPEEFTAFLGRFGQCANILALLFSLLGTSMLMRRFGLQICLLIFPVAVGLVITYVYMVPELHVVFFAMVSLKGLAYALNNPSKEMMYIPTSDDIKFKAKGWIDMVGMRGAKAVGSGITDQLKHSVGLLLTMGSVVSLGLVVGWTFVALFVGRQYKALIDERRVVD